MTDYFSRPSANIDLKKLIADGRALIALLWHE